MTTKRKSASAYLFRNFFHIVPIALVPALLLAYCAANGIHFDVILDLVFAPSQSASPVLDLASEVIASLKQNWWILLCAVAAFLFSTSFLIGKVERHMRYGLLSNQRMMGRAIRFIPRVAAFFALLAGCALLLYGFVLGAIYYINKFANGVWFVVAVAVLLFVFELLLYILLGFSQCVLPAIFSDDYKIGSAMSYSVRLADSKKRGVVFSFVSISLITRIITIGAHFFPADPWVRVAIFAVYYLWWFSYYPCLCCKVYEDFEEGERRDLPRAYGRR